MAADKNKGRPFHPALLRMLWRNAGEPVLGKGHSTLTLHTHHHLSNSFNLCSQMAILNSCFCEKFKQKLLFVIYHQF